MREKIFSNARGWCLGWGIALVMLLSLWGVSPAWASGGVMVQIERVPGVNQKASGAVKLGTVHIAEDRELPETMLEGDFLELILPEGVGWSDKTKVYFQSGMSGQKTAYEEDEEYSFSGERYLNISLHGVSEERDVLTIEPWVELDGFAGGKIYLSIQSDLLAPGAENEVVMGQCLNYGVTVQSASVAEGTTEAPFKPSVFTLQENCEGSFHQGEKVEISLPEGFVLSENNRFMTTKIISGSSIFEDPVRKNDNIAVLPVRKNSSSPVRVEISLRNILAPEDFSGDVTVRVKGETFDDTAVIAHIEPPKEKPQKPSSADTKRQTGGIFWINTSNSVIHGVSTKMNIAPYVKQGRAYLPVRYVAYALGVEEKDITWDADLELVTLKKGDTTVQLKIGSNRMLVNGVVTEMDVTPEITYNFTMLPARWVVEALGGEVEWNAEPPMMTIYTYEEA